MASMILSTVGGYFFGPVGQIAGSILGGILFGSTTKIQGSRIQDLKFTVSTYGIPIPIIYGTNRVSGNIIWMDEIIEHKSTTSVGKGGDSAEYTSYYYTCNFAISIGEGPIGGVVKIWFDGIIVFDTTRLVELVDLSINPIVYTGTEYQEVDSVIESIMGINNTPAFRGLAYIVFENLDITKYGARIPNITVEVSSRGNQIPLGLRGTIDMHNSNNYYNPSYAEDTRYSKHIGYYVENSNYIIFQLISPTGGLFCSTIPNIIIRYWVYDYNTMEYKYTYIKDIGISLILFSCFASGPRTLRTHFYVPTNSPYIFYEASNTYGLSSSFYYTQMIDARTGYEKTVSYRADQGASSNNHIYTAYSYAYLYSGITTSSKMTLHNDTMYTIAPSQDIRFIESYNSDILYFIKILQEQYKYPINALNTLSPNIGCRQLGTGGMTNYYSYYNVKDINNNYVEFPRDSYWIDVYNTQDYVKDTSNLKRYKISIAVSFPELAMSSLTLSSQSKFLVFYNTLYFLVINKDTNTIFLYKMGQVGSDNEFIKTKLWTLSYSTVINPIPNNYISEDFIFNWNYNHPNYIEILNNGKTIVINSTYWNLNEDGTSTVLGHYYTGSTYTNLTYTNAIYSTCRKLSEYCIMDYAGNIICLYDFEPIDITLYNILESLCIRAPIYNYSIDSSFNTTIVKGYLISRQGSIKEIIQELSNVYFFDIIEEGSTIKFRKRDSSIAVMINTKETING